MDKRHQLILGSVAYAQLVRVLLPEEDVSTPDVKYTLDEMAAVKKYQPDVQPSGRALRRQRRKEERKNRKK